MSTACIEENFGGLELLDFCRDLPKLELHAHINGSMTTKTMRELVQLKKDTQPELLDFEIREPGPLSRIEDFFSLFHFIYKLSNDVASVKYITRSVIKDFAEDGVKYLELRSTPRCEEANGMSKRDYIDAILEVIEELSSPDYIIVKLIVSIDRRHTIEMAMETAQLAVEYKEKGVVGVDVCGDPSKGEFDTIKPALEYLNKHKINLTIHMGELPRNVDEGLSMLSLNPGRVSHVTFLSDEQRQAILDRKIPLEICMSSNVLCKTVKSYESHHLRDFLDKDHPCVLCTDDRGVFGSPCSNEYALAARTFSLNKEELYSLSHLGIQGIFADDGTKTLLEKIWEDWKSRNLQ
ncbi:Metallo-dependent hydrolase [Basidiobolus meristosporus CBS 931.73]|uniref:Metallo-dependent hydrolase n=1 Tax=Basidiobolus meristosporus CBS 931.73 TaxID=1314790 RepID=A0A1Y1Z086_9FUNG|nr:Metallo-dependent hydrolase [Basidiobolus meristosporus CBS 931.73]|eukprot:ORY03702.1 Metallo-dependent hydrolase [Basidiobolus meristosporus CBS 931.73]